MATTSSSPVIRSLDAREENLSSRVLNRHVPAWVVSGAIHVVVIAFFLSVMSNPVETAANPSEDLVTTVADPTENEPPLTETELGFEADLKPATDAEKVDSANVVAPKVDDTPGLPNDQNNFPSDAMKMGLTPGFNEGVVAADLAKDGQAKDGPAGGGSIHTVPGMEGRGPATRDKLLAKNGGTRESQVAVGRGLAWLARMQRKDGSWEFDGSSKDKIAATGMALLPFLAAGETHKYGEKYKETVRRGLEWLMGRVGSGGAFSGTNSMYSVGIATVALCEAAGMTKDPVVKAKATLAVSYIVNAQGRNGSWGYTGPGPSEGDTSIVGWQIQALASAKMAEIRFESDRVFKNANRFLESVSTDSGAKYGYNSKGASQTLTPVGLLSRYYMRELNPRHPAFGRGVDFLKQFPPRRDSFDMYYYYYATQVVHFFEGPDWHKFWNPKMRDMLIDMQRKGPDESLVGSWDKDQGFIGSSCGRLGTTCLAILTLEVYYRHLPLYKRDGGGLADLER